MNRSRRRARALIATVPTLALFCVVGCHSGSTNGGAPTPSTSNTPASTSPSAPGSAVASTSEGVPTSSPTSASASPAASQSVAPSTTSASPSFASFSPTATYALPTVVAAFAGKDITQLPTTQHVVALTFDAGANADAVPEILATLHDENVPGTFFLTGRSAPRSTKAASSPHSSSRSVSWSRSCPKDCRPPCRCPWQSASGAWLENTHS